MDCFAEAETVVYGAAMCDMLNENGNGRAAEIYFIGKFNVGQSYGLNR